MMDLLKAPAAPVLLSGGDGAATAGGATAGASTAFSAVFADAAPRAAASVPGAPSAIDPVATTAADGTMRAPDPAAPELPQARAAEDVVPDAADLSPAPILPTLTADDRATALVVPAAMTVASGGPAEPDDAGLVMPTLRPLASTAGASETVAAPTSGPEKPASGTARSADVDDADRPRSERRRTPAAELATAAVAAPMPVPSVIAQSPVGQATAALPATRQDRAPKALPAVVPMPSGDDAALPAIAGTSRRSAMAGANEPARAALPFDPMAAAAGAMIPADSVGAGSPDDVAATVAPALSALIAAADQRAGTLSPVAGRSVPAATPSAGSDVAPTTVAMLAVRSGYGGAATRGLSPADRTPAAVTLAAPRDAEAAAVAPGTPLSPAPSLSPAAAAVTLVRTRDAETAAVTPGAPAAVASPASAAAGITPVRTSDAEAVANAPRASAAVAPSISSAAGRTTSEPARSPRGRAAERSRDIDAQPASTVAPATIAVPDTAAAATPTASDQLAATGADRQVELARHTAWADGIARDIASAGAATGTARFTVAPATLGAVSVEVSRSADGAAVRLVASSQGARDALDAARPQLVAEARAQGLHIHDASVDLAGSGGGSGSGAHRDTPAHQPSTLVAEPARAADVTDTNSLTTGAYAGAGGGEAGRQAQQQHARQSFSSPQTDRTAAAARSHASESGREEARRTADGRYA